jgi:glycosyltransferase involved in cell wall biosynthesis
MIKFGIVIPTYQRPDGKTPFYLKRALESIKNQTYQNFKIFLIGDKYDNNDEFMSFSEEIENNKIYIENLPSAYEREKYSHNKSILWSCGGVVANNHGVKVALDEGIEYICYLDHDDFWEVDHLNNFKIGIEEHKYDFLCSKSKHFNGRHLPAIDGDMFVNFLPGPSGLIKSSTCINIKTIPIFMRNVYEEDNKVYPSDADLWSRINKHITNNNLKSAAINKVTCNHLEEGYVKRS